MQWSKCLLNKAVQQKRVVVSMNELKFLRSTLTRHNIKPMRGDMNSTEYIITMARGQSITKMSGLVRSSWYALVDTY